MVSALLLLPKFCSNSNLKFECFAWHVFQYFLFDEYSYYVNVWCCDFLFDINFFETLWIFFNSENFSSHRSKILVLIDCFIEFKKPFE